jgi:hypothetical protein
MPALSDYLGGLLAAVTNARLQADLETARIAQLYASHPLLQHMAVARMRFSSVVLDLPVAVEGTDQPPPSPPVARFQALRQKVDEIVANELKQRSVNLQPTSQTRLTEGLNNLFDRLQSSPTLSPADATKGSADAVSIAMEAIKTSSADPATVDPMTESSLRLQLGTEFLLLHPPPPNVNVMVITSQIKDVAPPLVLSRIRLTITEEGVEWNQTNPNDPSSKTLLPE